MNLKTPTDLYERTMKKALKYLFSAIMAATLVSAMFVSCSNGDSNLIFPTHEVDFMDKTGDVVHGRILDLDVAGGKAIAVYDTLLMIITNNPAAFLQVYDTRTLQPLAMLCQQGRAKNEFSDKNIYRSDQIVQRNGDIIIILRGEGGNAIKEINVSASIREGHTVVEGINDRIPYGCGKIVGLDNGIDRLFIFNNHNYSLDQNFFNPPSFSIRGENSSKEIEIFKSLIDFEDDIYSTFWYSGSICKNPSRNILVQCMASIDYIHFFDLDNDRYFSVHQTETPTLDEIRVPNKIVDDVYVYDCNHFSESVGAEDFFLVIYMNGDYRRKNIDQSKGEATELLAFDWDGNYLGGVKLDMFAQDLAFDSKSNLLYGFRLREEKIVTFDLSDFIESIGQ